MLTLIVPGLIWPYQALLDLTRGLTRDLTHQPALPAFSTLLGRGKLTRLPPCTTHQALAQALGLAAPGSTTPLPAAALRGLALGAINTHAATDVATPDTTAADDWLCLDPVHLRVEQTRLRVDDPQLLALSVAEAEALAVSLAPTFAALGTLQVLTPTAWNLRLHKSTPALTFALAPPLPDHIARAAMPLPAGVAAAPWRHAINEANMLLHTHPINLAREAAGQPPVNTLWPWGSGRLPTVATNAMPPLAAFWGNDVVAQGAACCRNVPAKAAPPRYEKLAINNALMLLDKLELPARSGDTDAWRAELLELETDWFAPLLESLRRGHINHLRLIAPGDAASFALNIRRHHAWQFWRSAAPLTVLAAP
ncbi:hypothetical protein PG1C_07855 [Rugosibacter aromaticivorans]|uniref:Phosphoglycerate mutase n=1 Tax=Rugosibacter aromaticivorans TaxID=1565605 RepID=A0A0C5J9L9_9PROT|nr:hypothetical protein [Rugosibacter aromaticivorans]AJP48399.1 hypothetical protein PG1C_07855 [Rugosibacter aromaticivorans]TBR16382.1 MAG: hypothetical protein EPO43_00800 [Rugosibacter sp.]